MRPRIIVLTLALVAGTALSGPAAAVAATPPAAITSETLACHQSYASFAPNGALDHYGEGSAWTIRIARDGTSYSARGDGISTKRSATGAMTYAGGRLTFTTGPFHRTGWKLTGRYVPRGAKMPHDPHPGRRFPLVLRSTTTRHAELAPPRSETNTVSRSFFYCR